VVGANGERFAAVGLFRPRRRTLAGRVKIKVQRRVVLCTGGMTKDVPSGTPRRNNLAGEGRGAWRCAAGGPASIDIEFRKFYPNRQSKPRAMVGLRSGPPGRAAPRAVMKLRRGGPASQWALAKEYASLPGGGRRPAATTRAADNLDACDLTKKEVGGGRGSPHGRRLFYVSAHRRAEARVSSSPLSFFLLFLFFLFSLLSLFFLFFSFSFCRAGPGWSRSSKRNNIDLRGKPVEVGSRFGDFIQVWAGVEVAPQHGVPALPGLFAGGRRGWDGGAKKTGANRWHFRQFALPKAGECYGRGAGGGRRGAVATRKKQRPRNGRTAGRRSSTSIFIGAHHPPRHPGGARPGRGGPDGVSQGADVVGQGRAIPQWSDLATARERISAPIALQARTIDDLRGLAPHAVHNTSW